MPTTTKPVRHICRSLSDCDRFCAKRKENKQQKRKRTHARPFIVAFIPITGFAAPVAPGPILVSSRKISLFCSYGTIVEHHARRSC